MDLRFTEGLNAIISVIDCALKAYGNDERVCALHTHTFTGQNTNQYLLGYFVLRVMTGKHAKIEYLMQITDHVHRLVHVDVVRNTVEVIMTQQIICCKNVALRYPA